MYVRRRPTLPQPLGCSTIGAERLNFRVRYGTGCFPFRYGRRNSFNLHKPSRLLSEGCGFVGWELLSGREPAAWAVPPPRRGWGCSLRVRVGTSACVVLYG